MPWFNRRPVCRLVAGVTLAFGLASMAHAQGSGSATLDAIRTRGQVLCGIAGTVPDVYKRQCQTVPI